MLRKDGGEWVKQIMLFEAEVLVGIERKVYIDLEAGFGEIKKEK
jgi:hypothetical protein